jgi:hypothetical protein
MKRFRKTSRPVLRRRNRSCLRRALPRRPGPDELSQALTAFFRAVRCHRRLAKLAPRFFDAAIVDQEAFHRAERRCWMETWRPALNRAYGHDPDTPLPDDSDPLPPLPSPASQRAVEHELQELQRWMAVGRTAMETYPQRHPHALPTFSQIARLLRLALEFRQLACGMSSSGAAPPPSLNYDSVLADLERAYPRTSGEGDVAAPSPAPAPVVATPPKAPPAPPPSNAKPDLVPYALVIGPHGLPCLERVDPET